MSIALTTLQYLTMLVLREANTLAGDNILDNPVNPFPADTIARPTIAVYLGQDVKEDISGYGLFGAEHSVELSIQTFLPATLSIEVDGQKHMLSTRGNGLQFILGQIGAQIDLSLMTSDSEAAQLWRILVGGGPKKITTTPWLMEVQGKSGGLRIPAVERLMEVTTLADPLFAPDEIEDFWLRVIALFEADEEYAPVASLIRTMATGQGDLPEWRVAQGQLGLTEEGAAAIGLAPFRSHPINDETEASPLTEITLDPLGITGEDALPPEPEEA